jgi:hypothetical protein
MVLASPRTAVALLLKLIEQQRRSTDGTWAWFRNCLMASEYLCAGRIFSQECVDIKDVGSGSVVYGFGLWII